LAVRVVAFTPEGGDLVSAGEDGVVAVWDPQGRSEPRRFQNSVGTRAVAISPDGRQIAAGLHDGTVNVWDAATGEVVRRLSGADDFFALSFSPDGTLLAGACGERDVLLWNAVGREEGLAASVSIWARPGIETPNEESEAVP
jgi:WD40 repeat protein